MCIRDRGWYRWKNNPAPAEGLQLLGHRGLLLGESARTLSLNTPYIFKISVTSNANPAKPATYRFKVWEASQAEPATWDFEQQGNSCLSLIHICHRLLHQPQ